jgi:phosphonate transport system permease protein
MIESKSPRRSPILPAVLSALIPGLGQGILRRWYRGVAILLSILVVAGMVAWYAGPLTTFISGFYSHPLLAWFESGGFWFIAPAGMWLWNIWDAASLAGRGRTRTILLPAMLGLVAAFGIGWQVVQIDFRTASLERAVAVAKPMLQPDFVDPRREKNEMKVPFRVPCPLTGTAPEARREFDGKVATAEPDCAGATDDVLVTVTGLWPNTDTQIWWETAIGDHNMLGENGTAMLVVPTDADGTLTTTIQVPLNILIAQPDKTLSQEHRIHFDQYKPLGGYQLSVNGGYVVDGMIQTVTMALISTTLGVFLAIPISFLAARNLMSGNPVTFAIYVVVRTLLNIVRSIEALIIAIVFVVIVGLGPFAGVLAMAVHTVAALAKLYSEVIEGIDPGPIEAIRATGANWLQVVRYGVIPQIVPPFTAFTIYRWDINIRSSTIIGFVGGGGIGFYLIEWIRINDLRGVSAAFIAIAIVVMLLDFISAKVREKLV